MELLSAHTTLGLGGPCDHFVDVQDEYDLIQTMAQARAENHPVFILGGGSNVVVSDEGFRGWVIRLAFRQMAWSDEGSHVRVEVDGGVAWDDVVEDACARNLGQLALMSGIPGTMGAAPVQNIGAYGAELADVLDCVHVILRETGERKVLSRDACEFSYRDSIFKGALRDQCVITRVVLRLDPTMVCNTNHPEIAKDLGAHAAHATAMDIRHAVLRVRKSKSMVLDPHDPNSRSAGSFFMNPIVSASQADDVFARMKAIDQACPRFVQSDGRVKLSAARLLEAAGIARGFTLGGARVSEKHVLAITNPGHATTRDVLALAEHMQKAVKNAFDVDLHMEPVII